MSTSVDHVTAVSDATAYFDNLLGVGVTEGDEPNPTIEDSTGLVSYIYGSTNDPPQQLRADMEKVGMAMQSLVGITTAAVLKTAGEDQAKLHEFKTWWDPFAQIGKAFFGQFAATDRTENQDVRGVEIATQFIQIVLNAIVNEGAALNEFRDFLKGQGDTMRLEVRNDGSGYQFACLGIVHEVFELPTQEWVYVPKLRCYWTHFSSETFKVNGACASYDHFKFNFAAKELVGVFPYEEWKGDPDFREQLDAFIKRYRKARIEDSENYFDGVFDSREPE